jgi:seryl-tRNA synthetase
MGRCGYRILFWIETSRSLIRRVDGLSRFIDRQSRQLEKATEIHDQTITDLEAAVKEYEGQLDEAEQDYEFVVDDIDFMIKKYGSHMDPVFVERLMKDYGLNK